MRGLNDGLDHSPFTKRILILQQAVVVFSSASIAVVELGNCIRSIRTRSLIMHSASMLNQET